MSGNKAYNVSLPKYKDPIPLRLSTRMTGSLDDFYNKRLYVDEKDNYKSSLPEVTMRKDSMEEEELKNYIKAVRLYVMKINEKKQAQSSKNKASLTGAGSASSAK